MNIKYILYHFKSDIKSLNDELKDLMSINDSTICIVTILLGRILIPHKPYVKYFNA